MSEGPDGLPDLTAWSEIRTSTAQSDKIFCPLCPLWLAFDGAIDPCINATMNDTAQDLGHDHV
ncbi:MAG: hypothetical protein MK160_07090 [Rhodobacteraceae bacterium]|nr:hypothetical protein [Paracoccaceae bacterium]